MKGITNFKKFLQKGFVFGMLPFFLFSKKLPAVTFEDFKHWIFSSPSRGFEYNFDRKIKDPHLPTYTHLRSEFVFDYLGIPSWILDLENRDTSNQVSQVSSFLKDIYSGGAHSYDDFVDIAKQFSSLEDRLAFAGAVAEFLKKNGVNSERVVNQSKDDFSNTLENLFMARVEGYLNPDSSILYSEKFLKDIGFKSPVVGQSSALGEKGNREKKNFHVIPYNDKIAVVDQRDVFVFNTKNVQKALEVYQKEQGNTSFSYSFFEDSKFKYKLVTSEGKNYLDFIGYEESLDLFRRNISESSSVSDPLTKITFTDGNYETSGEINFFGLFFKGGGIKGDSSSSLEKMTLYEGGIKKNLVFPSTFLTARIHIGFMGGSLFGSAGKEEKIFGNTFNFSLASIRKEGFNFGLEMYNNFLSSVGGLLPLFSDSTYNLGSSYFFAGDTFGMKPYLTFQFKDTLKELSSEDSKILFSGGGGGVALRFKLNSDLSLWIDPYYISKSWEKGAGVEGKLTHPRFKISLGGYNFKSKYWMHPNKSGIEFKAGWNFRIFDGEISYKKEILNYDGEKSRDTGIYFKIGVSH